MKLPKPQAQVEGHGWEATPGRHPEDDLLRAHNFRIFSRPAVGKVLWIGDGEIYEQGQALVVCRLLQDKKRRRAKA